MHPSSVILLKSPTIEDKSRDPYYTSLSSRGYKPYFLPVLEHGFANEDDLDGLLAEGSASNFSGVIVTSGRAVEAWANSARRVSTGAGTAGRSYGWDAVPFYAVGPSTAAGLRGMSTSFGLDRTLCPVVVRGGDESGTGERLAKFIVSDFTESCPSASSTLLPLLYLTGDKAADTIPRVLKDAGLALRSFCVYETRPTSTFKADFERMLASLDGGKDTVRWIAFFSPSGCRTALPIITEHYELRSVSEVCGRPTEDVLLAAIGPTTASFLRKDCELHVSATPEKSDPEALTDALYRLDKEMEQLAAE